MIKSGLVVETNKRYACLLSSDGQFINVAIKGKVPLKGEIYTGELYKKTPVYRLPLIAAIIVFMIFLSGGFYTYYTPAAEVTITINPAVRLNLNVWNKIISSVPLNEDGEKLLSSLQLKNKDLNTGLDMIVNQAKVDKFINQTNVDSEKVISVEVTSNKNKKLDLSEFQQSVKAQNLKVEIVNDSKDKGNIKKSAPKKLDSKSEPKQNQNKNIKNDDLNKNKDNKSDTKEKIDKKDKSETKVKTDEKDKSKTNEKINEKSKSGNNKNNIMKDTKKTIDKNPNNTNKKEKEYKNKDKEKKRVNDIITFIKDKLSSVQGVKNSPKNNSNNRYSRGKASNPNKDKNSK